MQGLSPCGRRLRLPPSGCSRMKILRLAILLALAFPAAALAEDATIVTRNVPLAGERALASSKPPARFNLVGLHWRGPGSVQFRTRSLAGRWSAWEAAAPEAEDQPDSGTPERARSGSWRLGNPWWVGPSDRIEYRLRGKVTKLRAFFVWSPTSGVPGRTLQVAGAPTIVPRSGWNADEKIRRAGPSFAPTLRLALVHHTAGANGYSAAQSPAIVRGDPAVPRQGKRLERHRLQLPRRPLRPGVRRPLRRDRAQRGRRPRRGVQHRVGRRRAAR